MRSPLRWLGLLIGVFIGLILLVTGIGALLPVGKSGTRNITVGQSPEEVWAVLADVSSFPQWNPLFVSVDILTPVMWRAQLRNNATAVVFQTVESIRPRRLAHRIINSQDLGFGGSIVFDIEPASGGARVVMINNSEVYNPFHRFLRHQVLGPDSFARENLLALRAHLTARKPSK